MACRVKGIPNRSASHPKTVVEIPPIPMASPKINPDAMATFRGMKACPMAMVTELEEMIKSPLREKKMREIVPSV